jgi:ArsR family transcriptional regulator
MADMLECFKVLSQPIRLEIVKLLLQGERCGCTLIHKLPITQPTLSYHLKALTDAGITVANRDGNWIKHTVDETVLDQMIAFLNELKATEGTSCAK